MRLETARLLVRDLVRADLHAVHALVDLDVRMDARSREERARWLEWTVLDYEQRRMSDQPPYGEYGMELTTTDELVGMVGLVPSLMPFGLLPSFPETHGFAFPEVGLYWAVATAHQRKGYAAEAAAALVDYGFRELGLRRMVATTEHDNVASLAVMRRIGMRVAHNPGPAPFFLQAVGVIDNPNPPPAWPSAP